jgi:hypothetical protein
MIGWNRGDDARQLLTEVEDWCGRTSTPEGTVGHALFLHPGFVGLLRKRLTLSVEKEIAVREFIYWNHPDGYRGPLPLTHGNGTKPAQHSAEIRRVRGPLPGAKLSDVEIAARRVERDGCPRCGVRADVGCRHTAGASE